MGKFFLKWTSFIGFVFSLLALYVFYNAFTSYLEPKPTPMPGESSFDGTKFTLAVSMLLSYAATFIYMIINVLNVIISLAKKIKIDIIYVITAILSIFINIAFFIFLELDFSTSNMYLYLTLNIFHIVIIILQIVTILKDKNKIKKTELS